MAKLAFGPFYRNHSPQQHARVTIQEKQVRELIGSRIPIEISAALRLWLSLASCLSEDNKITNHNSVVTTCDLSKKECSLPWPKGDWNYSYEPGHSSELQEQIQECQWRLPWVGTRRRYDLSPGNGQWRLDLEASSPTTDGSPLPAPSTTMSFPADWRATNDREITFRWHGMTKKTNDLFSCGGFSF